MTTTTVLQHIRHDTERVAYYSIRQTCEHLDNHVWARTDQVVSEKVNWIRALIWGRVYYENDDIGIS
jgi:hypothetical protein